MMEHLTTYLEFKNSFLALLALNMCLIFGLVLWNERRHWVEPFYSATIGLWVYTIGQAMHQGWYWSWGHFGSRSPSWANYDRLLVLGVIAIIIAAGACCTIRNFTLHRYGHAAWLLMVALAALGALGSLALPS